MSIDRRDFLKTAAAGGAAVALAVRSEAATKKVETAISGRVGIDRRDKSGIIVTNGRDSVLTDEKGNFTLPVYEGMRYISVTPPSGFWCEWGYQPYPRRFDKYGFWLAKCDATAGDGCTFVHIADSEIGSNSPREKAWVDHVGALAAREKAAFIVHTGDICRWKGLHAHYQLMNDATMGRPVVYCIGNHDMEVGEHGEDVFESLYGPVWHSFEAGGVHFVVTPMPCGDYEPGYDTDRVADWIRGDLALVPKERPVVFFNHMISNWESSASEVGFTFGRNRKIRLDELCNFAGFVYGHVHYNRFVRVGADGKTAFVSTANPNMGGIGHSPVSTRVVHVDGRGHLTSKLVYGLHETAWKEASAGCIWESKVGSPVLFGEPLVADGRVFVGASDEDCEGLGGVVAFDARTGKRLWKAPMEGSVVNRLVTASGLVLAQDSLGHVRAFRSSDGSCAWSFKGPEHPWRVTYNGLVTDGQIVVTGTPMRLAALKVGTGEVVWSEDSRAYRIGEANSDTPMIAEGVLVIASNWRALYGYDVATGKILWRRDDEEGFRFPGATPTCADGKVYWLGGKTFYELDLRTGKTLRKRDLGCKLQVTTKVLVLGDRFIFGSADKGLLVLDRSTLKTVHRLLPGPTLVDFAPYQREEGLCAGTAPVPVGEREVMIAAGDGALHVWNVDTGREIRKIATGTPYLAGVSCAGSAVYAADLDGVVRRFEI